MNCFKGEFLTTNRPSFGCGCWARDSGTSAVYVSCVSKRTRVHAVFRRKLSSREGKHLAARLQGNNTGTTCSGLGTDKLAQAQVVTLLHTQHIPV